MNEEYRQKIALFRYGILAPLISGIYDEGGSAASFFANASNKTYTNPRGEEVQVSYGALERWYYAYRRDGFDALLPKKRSDTGRARKLDDDLKAQIQYLKEEYRRIPATLIHQKLIDNGSIKPGEVSLSTITRYVNQLMIEKKYTLNKDMRRYEREHINEVWCGDSSMGIYLNIDGKKRRTYIIALLDDSSRFIVGIDVFFHDNFINLMSVMKSAIKRYGKPSIFNFDNGKSYKNKQMDLLVARIGSTISYCMPYTPTSKAKIERWFSTLKQTWMSQLNIKDYKSINDLRISLHQYVDVYNKTIHSSLNGLSPEERFFNESYRIKRLSDEQLDTSFLLEYERRVSADSVVVLNDVLYEVDYRYAKQRITLRHSPDLKQVYVVDKSAGELVPIKLLNKHDNAHIKREKVSLAGGEE